MNYKVFFLVQNVLGDSKKLRMISLNAHYFVIFKNQRHQGKVQTLGSQIFPGLTSFFMDAYKKAVSYGYYLIDIIREVTHFMLYKAIFYRMKQNKCTNL